MTICKCDMCGKEVANEGQLIDCHRDIKINHCKCIKPIWNICEECYSTLQNTLMTEAINIYTKNHNN